MISTAGATELDKANRAYWEPQVTLTMGCPTGQLVFDQARQVVKVYQRCSVIKVTAPFVTVLAQGVGRIEMPHSGSFVHILVAEASTIEGDGPFSYVYWDRGNPSVKLTGLKTVAKKNPTS